MNNRSVKRGRQPLDILDGELVPGIEMTFTSPSLFFLLDILIVNSYPEQGDPHKS